jgi:hypothetical protein
MQEAIELECFDKERLAHLAWVEWWALKMNGSGRESPRGRFTGRIDVKRLNQSVKDPNRMVIFSINSPGFHMESKDQQR